MSGAGALTSGVAVYQKINELKELMKTDIDSPFLKVFKYVMTSFEILDNLIQGSAAVATLLKNAKIDFPFISVIVALGKFIEGIINFIKAKNAHSEQNTPGTDLEKSLKFWDAFDSGFGLMQAIVDCVLKIVTLTSVGISAGVTTAIGLAVKALVNVASLFFAGMKLKKIKDLKDRLVDYMQKTTKEFKSEVTRNRNVLVSERCSQFSTLPHSMIQNELADSEKSMISSSATLKNVTRDISADDKTNIEGGVVQFNKEMLMLICNEDNEFCPEFIDSLTIDRSFINDNPEIRNLLIKIGNMDTFAPINSMISVYKGMYQTQHEVNYTHYLSSRLLSSDYDLAVQTPRYDVYVCRGWGNQRPSLSEIVNFASGSSIKFAEGQMVQDTVQTINTNKKSEEEITEYLVAKFNETQSDDKKKFQEVYITSFPPPETPFAFSLGVRESESVSFIETEKNFVSYVFLGTRSKKFYEEFINAKVYYSGAKNNILSTLVHQDSIGKMNYVLLLGLRL